MYIYARCAHLFQRPEETMFEIIKKNSLLFAMLVGAAIYELFTHVDGLAPVSMAISPWLPKWLPVGLFLLLYVTFCKIKISELRPRTWHFVIQIVRTSIAAFMVFLITLFGTDPNVKLVLWLLLITPLFVCLIQFSLGKLIGRHWNDSISAGQALGQKNTVVGIWLTMTFLNPLAAVAPGAYVLWQNLVNGWQIWYKEKYGELKW